MIPSEVAVRSLKFTQTRCMEQFKFDMQGNTLNSPTHIAHDIITKMASGQMISLLFFVLNKSSTNLLDSYKAVPPQIIIGLESH